MIVLLYLGVAVALVYGAEDGERNLWVANIKGEKEVARGVARDLGLTYKHQGVGSYNDHYMMTRDDQPVIEPDDMTRGLLDHEHERWTGQKLIPEDDSSYQMTERSYFDDNQEQADLDWFLKSINESEKVQSCKQGPFGCVEFSTHLIEYLEHIGQTHPETLGTFPTKPAYDTTLDTYEGTTKHLKFNTTLISAYALKFSDPQWRKEWYMQDYRTTNYPVMDHNIVPVLNMKITGRGVTVGVIGDGVREHPDLGDNFEKRISYDFCESKSGSAEPKWSWTLGGYAYETDGTGSAGVIAMESGNEICGVGIAPDARIAGLKIRGCDASYAPADMEASAFNYKLQSIDIYCNVWTNEDTYGEKVVEMGYTLEHAYKKGITEGREKKGAIYVFPSGSNFKYNNCGVNGFLNNPYVITIASAASTGKPSSYSERCTAIFATGYSSSTFQGTLDIKTTNADGSCADYDYHKPLGPAMACGIFALVLQRKPNLSYRDMMHLIAMTAEVAPLADNKRTWYRNRRGFWVSSDFGFGLLNARNMIELAEDWKTVPDKKICTIKKKLEEPIYFDSSEKKIIKIDATECQGPDKGIVYLEHVELVSTIDYTYRGAIYMNITSPAGTKTEILEPRVKDFHEGGYNNLNVMSLHNWGENPKGEWEIIVFACRINGVNNPHGYIHEFTLKLHGTQDKPDHYGRPRKYAAFRLPSGQTSRF